MEEGSSIGTNADGRSTGETANTGSEQASRLFFSLIYEN